MWPSVIKGVASTKKLWVQVSVGNRIENIKKYVPRGFMAKNSRIYVLSFILHQIKKKQESS
jgi:hypothetical protein